VVYAVEELLQVHVHHPAPAAGYIGAGGLHCLMSTPAGPKPIRVIGELRVEHRAQNLMHCLLDKTIEYGGNSQRSHSPSRFGYLYLPYRLRAVLHRQQFFLNASPLPLQIVLQRTHRHPIDSGCSFIANYLRIGSHHIASTDDIFHQSYRFRLRAIPPSRDA
jgi:hypothetical protein